MGRKKFVTKLLEEMKQPDDPIEKWIVGVNITNQLYEYTVYSNLIERYEKRLTFYISKNKKCKEVASFQHWIFMRKVEEEVIEQKCTYTFEKSWKDQFESLKQVAEPGELPEGWGKLNGQTF